jgi:hypothetical protein
LEEGFREAPAWREDTGGLGDGLANDGRSAMNDAMTMSGAAVSRPGFSIHCSAFRV